MPTLNPTSLLFIPSPSFTTTSDIPTSTPGGAFGAPSAGESLSPGSIFDGGGGPALVVVFVAIGLLIGAFTALLIVRRMSAGGITFDDYEGQANGLAMWRYYEATEVPLGEEPKLFEMRLEREKGVKEGNERWRGMSPLSAKFIPDEVQTSPDERVEITPVSNTRRPARPARRWFSPISRFLAALRDYYVPRPRIQRTPVITPSDSVQSLQKSPRVPASGNLQVSVAIAMPRQSTSLYYSDAPCSADARSPNKMGRKSGHSGEVPEISLGLTNVRSIW